MKKICLPVLLLCLCASVCLADDAFNFRGVTWGMNMEEVRAVETGQRINDDPDSHLYNDLSLEYISLEPVLGYENVIIKYYFKVVGNIENLPGGERYLEACSYKFPDYNSEDTTHDRFRTDFEQIVSIYTELYDKPQYTAVKFYGRAIIECEAPISPVVSYKVYEHADFRFFLESGLICDAFWDLETTRIYIQISGNIGNPYHISIYCKEKSDG